MWQGEHFLFVDEGTQNSIAVSELFLTNIHKYSWNLHELKHKGICYTMRDLVLQWALNAQLENDI